MKYPFQEGALRPLCSSVAKNQNVWPWLALCSYPLAYFYTRCILFGEVPLLGNVSWRGWAMTIFAVLFLLGIEAAARAMHRPAAKETPLWAACWLMLSVSLAVQGHTAVLGIWQELAWYLLAIWCVLARCGMLAQGHTGALAPLDALTGCFTLPFGNFFARVRTAFGTLHGLVRQRLGLKKLGKVLGTALLTLLLCAIAWGQLSAADTHFAAIGRRFFAMWEQLFTGRLLSVLVYAVLSLPVGAWLFGLVSGAAKREAPPCPADTFYKGLEPFRLLPDLTARLAVGALCCLYGVFFALQLAEWSAAVGGPGLTAPEASAFAVNGFWELLRIQLLDIVVLAGIHFLGRRPLPKVLGALFCGFGIAFALLAGAKLMVYIRLYAFTPRRVQAGWFLCVLLVWAVLLLVRVFRPIPAARIGLVVLAVSFVLLGCVDVDRRIVNANLTRWEQGIDETLDTHVLASCGAGVYWNDYGYAPAKTTLVVDTACRLVKDGWFIGQDREEISDLYYVGYDGQNVYSVELDAAHTLQLTFAGSTCTAAEIKTA